MELNKIYNMDCLDGLKLLDENSIDSIVTDPPYELGFMGKKWDKTGISYRVDLWKECLRVLKPGGHLLAFGGTRTYHRMACAIEDAGFEIRDQIQWIYGSGFPKSMDISKALDKKAGEVREIVGYRKPDGSGIAGNAPKDSTGSHIWTGELRSNKAITIEAQQWNGWGTALKPANEPICLARKPLSEKTVAENVLKWGVGGLNIDDCRVPTDEVLTGGGGKLWSHYRDETQENAMIPLPSNEGRFPSNVILDETAATLLDEQTGILKSGHMKAGQKRRKSKGLGGYGNRFPDEASSKGTPGDSGGASRFFYCAKASQKERGEGNKHPTVKPLNLIKYLITLITPPNGITVDPFMGSGTTALAAYQLGINYVCFELILEHIQIADKRLYGITPQLFV